MTYSGPSRPGKKTLNDNITLLLHNHEGTQSKTTRLVKVSARTGLRNSKFKERRQGTAGEAIDEVQDLTHLRSIISKNGGSDRNIEARIRTARNAFAILKPAWRSKMISRKTMRLRIFTTNEK